MWPRDNASSAESRRTQRRMQRKSCQPVSLARHRYQQPTPLWRSSPPQQAPSTTESPSAQHRARRSRSNCEYPLGLPFAYLRGTSAHRIVPQSYEQRQLQCYRIDLCDAALLDNMINLDICGGCLRWKAFPRVPTESALLIMRLRMLKSWAWAKWWVNTVVEKEEGKRGSTCRVRH